MSILSFGGLPTKIDGVPISPDFRNMINIELIFADNDLTDREKIKAALINFYPGMGGELDENGSPIHCPDSLESALKGLIWFYRKGKETDASDEYKARKKGYDWAQDADYIYSSFAEAYGILLSDIEYMHWWEFLSLFSGLPEDTFIKKIIYWRTADLSRLSKHEKAHVIKMRDLFALKQAEKKKLSMEEIEAKTHAYYDSRTKKVQV